jgi:RNA polymerase sigma-70 factor (ECF subfamily)
MVVHVYEDHSVSIASGSEVSFLDPSPETRHAIKNAVRLAIVENRKRLVGYLRRRIGSVEDAEDARHDAYVRVLRAGDCLLDTCRVDAWLHRILRNAVVDQYRREAGRKRLYQDYFGQPRDSDPTDDEELDDRTARLHRLLPMLKPAYAEPWRRAKVAAHQP